jgi:hypothetical protein
MTQEYQRLQEEKRAQEQKRVRESTDKFLREEFLGTYVGASKGWQNFRDNQPSETLTKEAAKTFEEENLKTLSKAAKTLEEIHLIFQADEEFWAQLRSLPDMVETKRQREEIDALLQDFDYFLAFEEHLLVKVAKLSRGDVARLLTDVNDAVRVRNRALRMVRSRADIDAIENLQDRSKDLQVALHTIQDEISEVLSSDQPPSVSEDPRKYRWANGVRKSLLFISGAGLASFNLFLLDPASPAAPSVIGGTQAMIQQFPEGLLRRIGKSLRKVGRAMLKRLRG